MPEVSSLCNLMSPEALTLLSASGKDLVQQIGLDVVRGVVLDVLTGRNLRDSTEMLTRHRIATLNLAMVNLFLTGENNCDDFVERLPYLATNILSHGNLSKSERWLAQWVLGLTDKGFQNVLRDDASSLDDYRDRYVRTCQEVIANQVKQCGNLSGELVVGTTLKAQINWLFMTYLLNTVGAQTLAIRGSEKSAYGKLFEKLVLGALLCLLGFKHITPPPREFRKVFWLSSREEKRESDATLLFDKGKGVRFDIGFIGRGNPEISLDKVTRFEREISLGRSSHFYMTTVILVDRVGENSRIEELAQKIGGTIIQMSASYWPQQVAQLLHETLGFEHEMVDMPPSQIGEFLKQNLGRVPLEEFIRLG